MNENSDQQLVKSYLDGEEESLVVLLRRYFQPIYVFVYGMVKNDGLAEDLTQDIFIKTWQKLSKYDPEQSFKVWLYRLARNLVVDYWRKNREDIFSSFETESGLKFEDILIDNEQTLLEQYINKEEIDNLRVVLDNMSVNDRQVLDLYYKNDLNFREIAEVLEESIDTIKSRQRRALIKLKKLIEL
ncbi:MAG: sigma-70 family RNA polymerase sigma factor [bacterium]